MAGLFGLKLHNHFMYTVMGKTTLLLFPIISPFPGELAKLNQSPVAIVEFLHSFARAATEVGDDFLVIYPIEVCFHSFIQHILSNDE